MIICCRSVQINICLEGNLHIIYIVSPSDAALELCANTTSWHLWFCCLLETLPAGTKLILQTAITPSLALVETISFLRAYNTAAIKIKLDICKACQESRAHKSNRRSAHNNEPRGWQVVVPLNSYRWTRNNRARKLRSMNSAL